MNHMIKIFIPIWLILFPASLFSQEENSYSFSLEEAMEFAVTNNASNQNARLDREIAKKEVWKTLATGLPQVNGTYDFQHLPGKLPSLSFPDGNGGFREVTLGVKNSATYNVTVSQLVFSGEYIVGLQASRTYVEQSKNAEEKSRLDTRETVASAYFSVLVLEKNLSVLDSSLTNLEKTLAETEAMARAGFMEDTDVEQIRISYNSLKNSVNAVTRQVELAMKLLKIQLGLGLEDELNLTDDLVTLIGERPGRALLQEEFSLAENIDYISLETQETLSQQLLKREQAKYLPTVSAFYLYQDRTNKPDFDITFNHIIGINVSVPIFSSGQRAASVSQARVELEKIRNTKKNLSETLLMGFDQARSDYLNALENYELERENIDLSEKIFNQTLIRYREGMVSSMDVTQANNQYLDSYAALNNTMMELFNARIRLQKVMNQL